MAVQDRERDEKRAAMLACLCFGSIPPERISGRWRPVVVCGNGRTQTLGNGDPDFEAGR